MAQEEAIRLFEGKQVRFVWDDEKEKYYFSVVDVIQVLTDSADYQVARKYWKVLKGRLLQEGNETVTNCYQLKMKAPDGKMRSTARDFSIKWEDIAREAGLDSEEMECINEFSALRAALS